MNRRLPLPTLLSQCLVAFTIEFDNEAEHRMPHRTTNHGRTADSPYPPWLVSLAMWSNCMQFVGERGVTVRELHRLARTETNLNGMERWGYVIVEPDPADNRPKPPRADWLIRATPAGRKAQEIWRPLSGEIEQRWRERFGEEAVEQLQKSLERVTSQVDAHLPDCLPIPGYGLFSRPSDKIGPTHTAGDHGADSRLPLSVLLSRVPLAFAIEFEKESELSLAICANVVRVLDEKGVLARDLPRMSGVSKELIKTSVGFLQKGHYVAVVSDPTAKGTKIVRLTPKGREAQEAYLRLLEVVEQRWKARFGKDVIRHLRESLEHFVGEPTAKLSPLFRGLEPYPEGWRASVRKPESLPHYPMVTHRGGFPDGS